MAPNYDNTSESNTSDELNHTGVSFAEAVDNQPAYRKKSSQELRAAKERASLSASAKAWDLDGDGELDDAEMALRNLDRSHKGTLSKDQMYELMSQNLKTQRELFKVKKVVIGLVAFTCILALSNLGTSFAAAFLAKDTKSVDGKLVDSHTGQTMKTDSSAATFTIDQELSDANRRQRRLECRRRLGPGGGNGGGNNNGPTTTVAPVNVDCTFDEALDAISEAHGRAIIEGSCQTGGTANVIKEFPAGSVSHSVCAPGYSISYGTTKKQGTDYPTMTVTRTGTGLPNVNIAPNEDNPFMSYIITGLYSGEGQVCGGDTDCDSSLGLTCQGNYCYPEIAGDPVGGMPALVEECVDGKCSNGLTCYNGFCGACQVSDHAGCAFPSPTCVEIASGVGYCTCDGNRDCTDHAEGTADHSCGTGSYCGTENWCSTDHDNDSEFNPCYTTSTAAPPAGMPALTTPCFTDTQCATDAPGQPYCTSDGVKEGFCATCRDDTAGTDIGCTATAPHCTVDGESYYCQCLDNSDCSGAETCSAPSGDGCPADIQPYCSLDHNADHCI
jgi:hypothetical protein